MYTPFSFRLQKSALPPIFLLSNSHSSLTGRVGTHIPPVQDAKM